MWEFAKFPVTENPVYQDLALKKSAKFAVLAIKRIGPTRIPTTGPQS
jgi:hypothetical protein